MRVPVGGAYPPRTCSAILLPVGVAASPPCPSLSVMRAWRRSREAFAPREPFSFIRRGGNKSRCGFAPCGCLWAAPTRPGPARRFFSRWVWRQALPCPSLSVTRAWRRSREAFAPREPFSFIRRGGNKSRCGFAPCGCLWAAPTRPGPARRFFSRWVWRQAPPCPSLSVTRAWRRPRPAWRR